MIKFTIQHIRDFKRSKQKLSAITAYDYTSAQIINEAQIPLILVGDSASMMVYGYDTTIPISMDEMLLLVKAVTRGAKNSLVVADMPFLSYQPSLEQTIKNAGLLIKKGGASAVKLEGGIRIKQNVRALVDHGIPVLGHVGLTPQSFHQMSGYKVQGKNNQDAQKIIDDSCALEESGAFGIVLECIPEDLAEKITNKLKIPTIGIGSGKKCDGQIQVFHDVLGYSPNKPPKHAMQYNTLYKQALDSIKKYKADIENL